jgi:hypothetical protein
MSRWPATILIPLAAALALSVPVLPAAPPAARADEIPAWPSEQASRLEQVESQLLSKQRELAAARRRNDGPAIVERLSKEFKTLQDERVELLRATRQFPR